MNKTYLRGDLPEENNETPPKKKMQVFGLFFPARSEKQQAASTGWLPVRP